MNIYLLLLNLYLLTSGVNCARILIMNPYPGYSHQVVFNGIAKELSKRGHDIVSIATNPMNDKSLKNLREIDTSFIKDIWLHKVNTVKPDMFNKVLQLYEVLVYLLDIQLQHPEIQGLIKNKTEHFDLVMLSFITPATFAFKFRFNCPFVGMLTLDGTNVEYASLGNGVNSASYADTHVYKPIRSTLIRRLYSFCMNSIIELHQRYVIDRRSKEVIRKNFGEDYPDCDVLRRDIDLLFVNSNPILNYPRAVTSCTISIGGGIHIEGPKELPKDIKTFLDNSKRGVIYMSFGSNIQSSELPGHIKKLFFKVFADLPYDIMWKFENATSEAVPKNLLMRKWMPQQDILRHKNIKLFITHGGLQSMEEAIFNHVPMLTIPFYGDQLYNSHKIYEKEVGIMIDNLDALTSERLKSLILEIIQNPMYKNNTRKLSAILEDQPMTPMEKAVWWTEYVIRHKGAKHLRGPDLPTYQLYLLDVFGILLLLLLIVLFILYKLLQYVYRKVALFLIVRKIKVS